jgi:hypothetical protein
MNEWPTRDDEIAAVKDAAEGIARDLALHRAQREKEHELELRRYQLGWPWWRRLFRLGPRR